MPSISGSRTRAARGGSAAIRFENRLQAGQALAEHLLDYAGRSDVLVLALPRGGVPVGFALARRLAAPLDVLLVRKIGMPGHPEYALGAIASGGVCILQAEAVSAFDIPPAYIEASAQHELQEIERREKIFRAHHPALPWRAQVVILVDDGLATGSTMEVAAHVVREANPASLIAAVPVGAPQACERIAPLVDRLLCLSRPDSLYSVGRWYDDFSQVEDDEVTALLKTSRRACSKKSAAPGRRARAWVARTPDQEDSDG